MKANIVEKFNQLPPDLHEKAMLKIPLAKKELRRKKELKLGWWFKRISGPVYRP